MAPGRIKKKSVAQQLRHAVSLKTLEGVQKFLLEMLEDEKDTKPQSVRLYSIKTISNKATLFQKYFCSLVLT